jgi:hypothetical protein
MKFILGVMAAAGLLACGNVCSQFQSVANDCGGTLNEASCNNALASCSSTDQSILSDFADCVEKPAVCNNGQVVNAQAQDACISSAAGLSTSCSNAMGF